ncbi:PREDICTED: citron Rho-interacting kinase-like isoform X1 [Amphimedon queenslandica]|uniref:Phorbol-ester/DAG-type domain-containing protein n=1 Tax=Amphimedon queenslandica TaxID=400682 RepID=A0AAN0JIY6_AMPQE|nr:PREDICTED: citron Rho-interacting kinase-like isoform X1 [Amphimedon queenslandica]|eukprot:XP_019856985.1 PREDICTED: citron Rho-interacting kinase-like isoform X1 [Amphimedon queenslandica]
MMDLHRRLESERKERGTSNTKALQLLAEVRENNKIAKEMRDTENKELSEQVQSALVQLEQERVSAVKRCQRAHEELKKKQIELDCCTAKVSDLKSRLAHARERSKIDTAHLQDKLQRLSDDSKKRIMTLHNEYAELQDRFTAVNKELKQLKELQIKQENASSSARVSVTSSRELEELKVELETQKQLTDQYSAKVLECEKELSLKTVQCQEMEKSLDLEATLKQSLQDKYDAILKELKCYEEAEGEEPKTTPTSSNTDDNISSLQEELLIQKQLTDEYNFKVLEYEKELGMKTVECQEMTEALKLEQNLNNKLYDDIYHLRQEHGKLQAAHMKLSKQLKTQESRAAEASKETEQALQDKAVIEEALELERTRMQIQLAQFTKLIDYRHNTPSAAKKRSNPKKGLKLSRKKRDPEKERSEWMILKDIAKNSKDNKAGDNRVSRSPSISSILVDQATPGGQSVRSTRNNKPSVTPGATSSLVCSSSVAPTPSKSGIKRSAPDSSSAVLEHNIPHRWVIKSGAFHKSHSCSTCSGSIKHTQKYAKCAYCSFVVHQKCTSNTPNSCGLPLQLAAHLYPTSPSKRQCSQAMEDDNKENASFVSTSSMDSKMRRLSIDLVRCNSSIMSTGTDLSITSSMLASNDSNDDSLV